jgi:hypothetical protein
MSGLLIAAGLCFATVPVATAAPVSGIDLRGAASQESVIEHVQEGRYCRRLRRACKNKDARGETGEGNCRRYRRECGRD